MTEYMKAESIKTSHQQLREENDDLRTKLQMEMDSRRISFDKVLAERDELRARLALTLSETVEQARLLRVVRTERNDLLDLGLKYKAERDDLRARLEEAELDLQDLEEALQNDADLEAERDELRARLALTLSETVEQARLLRVVRTERNDLLDLGLKYKAERDDLQRANGHLAGQVVALQAERAEGCVLSDEQRDDRDALIASRDEARALLAECAGEHLILRAKLAAESMSHDYTKQERDVAVANIHRYELMVGDRDSHINELKKVLLNLLDLDVLLIIDDCNVTGHPPHTDECTQFWVDAARDLVEDDE